MKVDAIEPHGMCAGVNAAIAKALTLRDVYCLHELVHNEIVVGELKALGFRFVERIEDVPMYLLNLEINFPRMKKIIKKRVLNKSTLIKFVDYNYRIVNNLKLTWKPDTGVTEIFPLLMTLIVKKLVYVV